MAKQQIEPAMVPFHVLAGMVFLAGLVMTMAVLMAR